MAKKKKNKKEFKECEWCMNLIPIGEGDHICNECGVPKMVISDYAPTNEYLACGGRCFEE